MKVIITGGGGFIGINAAQYFLQKGNDVILFDSLYRKGATENIEWIKNQFSKVTFIKGDIQNIDNCEQLFQIHHDVSLVLHLAAQVAVTTSVTNPREDFEKNALGTLNILEGIRKYCSNCIIIYSSTNKVYGYIDGARISERNDCYFLPDYPHGISENTQLDFHSPYGCSKGAADQYVHDYSRIYGLKTIVFRQSCIYGYRQFGIEDQGWIAWFTIASIINQPITIYGNGKQVRDVLFIDDLISAYDLAFKCREKTSGQIYNIGGGPNNSLSLHKFINHLESFMGGEIDARYSDWRPGDQKVYISDIRKAQKDFGWSPVISVGIGIKNLHKWIKANKVMIISTLGFDK
tara:strand:+ start:6929 stop:7972 length:1044 start_codon:yes stop_codon:yes gene_type:complete